MFKTLLFLLIISPILAIGQFKITGKIIDSADKKPIPGATIFLSNASAGTATAVDGTFTLDKVKSGQYELVVSMVGYQTYRKAIFVNENVTLNPIALSSRSVSLKEVNVHPDPEWERNYEVFRSEFLGKSEYAKACKILNPEVLDISYDQLSRKLTANSSDFVIVENWALGYRIKYLLNQFEKDYRAGIVYYEGTAFFENLKGKKSQERKWAQNRLKVYKGSSMHFLRSLIANRVADEGFKVLRLVRQVNPKYNGNYETQYIDQLHPTPLTADDYVRMTDRKGLYTLAFSDCLYILYDSSNSADQLDINPAHIGMATTVVIFNKPYALFDHNGIFLDPSSITFDGEWGKSRLATMLPVDYEPGPGQ